MHTNGGTVAGVAKATSPIRENDKSRPWREVIAFEGDEEETRIIASDGRMVAQATIAQNTGGPGLLRRRDAERFDKEDALEVDGEAVVHVEGSELRVQLEEKLEDGTDYPTGPADVLKLHPQGRPAFRCDPRFLRRALQGLILAGVEKCEVFVAPKAGSDGMLFIQGMNDADDSFVFALGMPRTAERKSGDTGEIVEYLEQGPLFAGAEEPPKDEAPDGKTAAAGPDPD